MALYMGALFASRNGFFLPMPLTPSDLGGRSPLTPVPRKRIGKEIWRRRLQESQKPLSFPGD